MWFLVNTCCWRRTTSCSAIGWKKRAAPTRNSRPIAPSVWRSGAIPSCPFEFSSTKRYGEEDAAKPSRSLQLGWVWRRGLAERGTVASRPLLDSLWRRWTSSKAVSHILPLFSLILYHRHSLLDLIFLLFQRSFPSLCVCYAETHRVRESFQPYIWIASECRSSFRFYHKLIWRHYKPIHQADEGRWRFFDLFSVIPCLAVLALMCVSAIRYSMYIRFTPFAMFYYFEWPFPEF